MVSEPAKAELTVRERGDCTVIEVLAVEVSRVVDVRVTSGSVLVVETVRVDVKTVEVLV